MNRLAAGSRRVRRDRGGRRWDRVGAIALTVGVLAAVATAAHPASPALERITLAPHLTRTPLGQAQRFTATGHYTGGITRNLTQRLDYTSSDPAIARAANDKGDRSRIDAVGVGTATISATDPRSGVSSHASGDDATLAVLGALERLTLEPAAVNRWIGQSQRFTVTGHYAGGGTRNLTQHVGYRSSDPTVAAVPNKAGDRSRVDAVGIGTATIAAVDDTTGLTSSAGGGDATVTVTLPQPRPEPRPLPAPVPAH